MKTAKLFLSILGVTLVTLSFGQLLSLHETNKALDLYMSRMMEVQDEVLYYTAHYNAENGRTVHWVNHQPDLDRLILTSTTPLVHRTYFAGRAEAIYEENPVVESWMTTPFKSSLEDEELRVEEWMTTPFNTRFSEDALEIEPWMTDNWL